MAETVDLQVIAPSLPAGSCLDPSIVDLIAATRVLMETTNTSFIQGPNEPTVEQRNFIWVKTLSTTDEIVGIFKWSPTYGIWLKRHFPNGVPTNERRIFKGTLVQLETHDGGESATVSDTTGPFWEQDTDYTDNLLVGAGAVAVDTSDADWVSYNATGTDRSARGVYIIKPTGRIYDRSS